MHSALPPLRACLLAALATLVAACDSSPNALTLQPVTVGHVSGVYFTVTSGTIYQAEPDGPLYANESGGELVLDDDPAGLGMSDPDLLRLRTQFALTDGGTLQISAFGVTGEEIPTGVGVLLSRVGSGIGYDARLGGVSFADGLFSAPPGGANAEQWVVTESYADSVPGYGAGQSGVAFWRLGDLTAAAGTDVLGCDPGPAIDPTPRSGDRVSFALRGAWLLAVEVEDQIAGPCT